jgi:hypothetical protein
MIAGTNSFSNNSSDLNLFWSTYPIVWGWATTKDKWKDLRKALFEQNFSRVNYSSLSTYYYFRSGKMGSLNGLIDAWDLPLAGSFHSKNWICLIPPKNLVSNIGFDTSATHTIADRWPLRMPIESLNSENLEPVNLSNNLCLDSEIERNIYRIKYWHLFSLVKQYLKPINWSPQTRSLSRRMLHARQNYQLGKE